MYTRPQWLNYGLAIADSVNEDDRPRVTAAHDLVASYLLAHPDVAEKYKPDQSGEVKYYDVLELAEVDHEQDTETQ